MKNKRSIFLSLCVAAMAVIILVSVQAYRLSKRPQTEEPLNLPIEVIREDRQKSLSTTIWSAKIFLPIEHYSRENLERLFRYYSKKYPDRRDVINVYVFTSKENVRLDKENPPSLVTSFPHGGPPDFTFYDASFYRENPGGSIGHFNEWYIYRPDPNNPENEKTVVLKGVAPRTSEDIVETKEVSRADLKIRVSAYKLKDVEPEGVYYGFDGINKDALGATVVMTFRRDEQVPIPLTNIRFVNDQIAYIFMGWMYAVTTDGGRTWSVWDASEALPNWKCCNYDLIEEVRIEDDGTGNMRLGQIPGQSSEVSKLVTKDYGQHWAVK